MSSYVNINPNPKKKNVGDCVVRAICLAEDMEWDQVYLDLCIQGYTMADMPSSNDVWSAYMSQAQYNKLSQMADQFMQFFQGQR